MKNFKLIVLFLLTAAAIFGEEIYSDIAQGDYSTKEGLLLIERWESIDNTELARGIVYHNICETDLNPEWIEKSLELLSQVYTKTGNPLALGYLGSAMTVKAGYQYENNQILKSVANLDEGAKKIDMAISLDTENVSLRFLRLINAIEVSESSPVSRDKVIEEDISYLVENASSLSSDEQGMLYYYKGRYLLNGDKIDEGLSSLEQSIRKSPGSSSGKLARELLLMWEE